MIYKVGIELEGGWYKDRIPTLGTDIVRDGSVTAGDTLIYKRGEVNSRPYVNIGSLREWFINTYPDVVNGSCGLHIHFSFKTITAYSYLLDSRFKDYFYGRLKQWGDKFCKEYPFFWARVNGENRYCTPEWNYENQLDEISKNYNSSTRYGAWNFCFNLHRTAECRVLPMWDANEKETAWNGVLNIVDIVQSWIDKCDDEQKINKTKIDFVEDFEESETKVVEV